MSKQTVKLAIQQLWHYALYFRQQPRLPSQRFAIFGRGRSGSTVLTSLLNAHRHISCEGEILHDRVFFPRLHIDWCASRCQSEVYGFKLLSYQLRDVQPIGNPARFLRSLYDGGYQFIYLTRRNLLFHALSNLNARQNKFHHRLQEGTLASAPLAGERKRGFALAKAQRGTWLL